MLIMGFSDWIYRKRKEALTVVVHRAVLKRFNGEPLDYDETDALHKYFPRGYVILSESEYRSKITAGTINQITQDIVSVNKDSVDIHTHVEPHNYSW